MVRTLASTTSGLLLAFSATAASADAQQVTRADAGPAPVAISAERLHEEAARLQGRSGYDWKIHFRKAARLHLKSAALRAPEDPQAEACLAEAASLLYDTDPARSSTLLEIAGVRAQARGDVLQAAQAYLDAAWIVAEQKRVSTEAAARAHALVVKAQLLAQSPLLTADERDRIATRTGTIRARVAARGR